MEETAHQDLLSVHTVEPGTQPNSFQSDFLEHCLFAKHIKLDLSAVGTGGHVPPTFLEIAVVTFENNAAQNKISLLCPPPPPPPRYNFLPTVVDLKHHGTLHILPTVNKPKQLFSGKSFKW